MCNGRFSTLPRSALRVAVFLTGLGLVVLAYVVSSRYTGESYRVAQPRTGLLARSAGEAIHSKTSFNVQEVREVFHSIDHDKRSSKLYQDLLRAGEEAFPDYEAILSDLNSPAYEVSGVLGVLSRVEADPRRFLDHAVSRLTDNRGSVSYYALQLLKRIGGPAEAPRVVPLLLDENIQVAYAAAKTLTAIGGPRELEAMDEWLREPSNRDEKDLWEGVKECRDALKERLDKTANKAK